MRALNQRFLAAAGREEDSLAVFEKLSGEVESIKLKKDAALRTAAFAGLREKVEFLLNKGANINSKQGGALQNAVKAGHFEIVKILLARGSVLNEEMLKLALDSGKLEIIQYLVEKGAPFTASTLSSDIVIKSNDAAILEYFGSLGVEYTKFDLALAIHVKNVVSMQFLIKRGFRVEKSDDFGDEAWEEYEECKLNLSY